MYPPLPALAVGAAGRVWAGIPYEAGADFVEFEVFSIDGELLGAARFSTEQNVNFESKLSGAYSPDHQGV
jgi:hypothetical protein